MTHYRLTLTAGKAPGIVILAEVHKDVPRLEQGWGRKMRASKAVSAHLRQCYVEDEQCNAYQAWLQAKDEHEDDPEAEALKEAGA